MFIYYNEISNNYSRKYDCETYYTDNFFFIKLDIVSFSPFVKTNRYEKRIIDIVETIETIAKRNQPSSKKYIGIKLIVNDSTLIIIIPHKTFLK